jgi:hypothetical protein
MALRNIATPGLTQSGSRDMSDVDIPDEDLNDEAEPKPLTREERQRIYKRRWRELNQEHIRAYVQQYNGAHREYINKRERERVRARKAEAVAADERRRKARSDYAANREHRLAQQAMNNRAREARDPERYKALRAATNARFNAAHRDELTERQRRERLHQPGKVADYNKTYKQRNAAAVRQHAREYYQANKDDINARARHRRALAIRRREAGLPDAKLRRRAQGERAANILAADAFFARTWSQRELRHIQHREAWRLIASLHQAQTRELAALTPSRPHEPTERELENARLDAIARHINNRLRTHHQTIPIAQASAEHAINR